MIDDRTAGRTAFTLDEHTTALSLDNQAQDDLDWERVQNKLLAGYAYDRFVVDDVNRYGHGPNLDMLSRDYSPPVELPPVYQDQKQTVDQYGLYMQIQTKLDQHWILTLSSRQAWVDADRRQLNWPKTDRDDNAFTGKAGLGYLLDNGLTPYVSYAESFVTDVGTTKNGTRFEPSEGTQYEAGVKYEPTLGRCSHCRRFRLRRPMY
jgi:iron complex outermembrane receptor protein